MVYAFLLQSVGIREESNIIVYSEVFGTGLNLDVPPSDQRQVRKRQLVRIADRVNSEYRFKKACHLEAVESDPSHAERLTQAEETGVFRLPAGKFLPAEKHVVWKASDSCCFSMILSPSENKALAENVLSLIIRYLLQTFKHFDQTEEMAAHPDKIAAILHNFLPNGQLVFMNHRVVKQLEKELYRIINESK